MSYNECPEEYEGYEIPPQGASELKAMLERTAVLRAVNDEPELPDAMPDEMWYTLKIMAEANDRDGLTEALRIIVRQTKAGINERISAL